MDFDARIDAVRRRMADGGIELLIACSNSLHMPDRPDPVAHLNGYRSLDESFFLLRQDGTSKLGDGAVGALSLKPYCAAKQTIAAIDALRNILGQGISHHDIVALRVIVPPAYAEMIGHRHAAGSRIARITSVAYQLALAAYRPDELENVARPNLAGVPEIAAFMARVEVVPDQELEQYYPQRWPARVETVLKNGRTETNLVLDATGDPACSCNLDVRGKFHRLADPVIGTPRANELATACLAATEHDEALTKFCATFNS